MKPTVHTSTPIFELSGLTKQFKSKGGTQNVLDGLNWTVGGQASGEAEAGGRDSGRVIGLLGRNGAGKPSHDRDRTFASGHERNRWIRLVSVSSAGLAGVG